MSYSLKNLLNKYHISARKKWGQNWLIDNNVISKIINLSGAKNNEVVEIGPGLGALTFSLVKVAKTITAYEIDPLSIKILQAELSANNLKIVNEDFLKANFLWTKPCVLIGNIPYYITSQIIFKVLKNYDKFSQVTLTVQNEMADRLIAPIGSKHYGKLTVSVNYFASVQKHFIIKSNQFFPEPNVDSAVITLTFKNNLQARNHEAFLSFVKHCFTSRRKTLFNNLKLFVSGHAKINDILQQMNLSSTIRPQELSVDNFLQLYDFLTPTF